MALFTGLEWAGVKQKRQKANTEAFN